MSELEEQALLAAAAAADLAEGSLRRAAITLAIEAGARHRELVDARWDQMDVRRPLWHIPSRGGVLQSRAVPLSARALNALSECASRQGSRCAPIFHDAAGLPRALLALAKVAGLTGFHFAELRATALTRLALLAPELSLADIARIHGRSTEEIYDRCIRLRKTAMARAEAEAIAEAIDAGGEAALMESSGADSSADAAKTRGVAGALRL